MQLNISYLEISNEHEALEEFFQAMSSILEQQFRTKWTMWAALGAGCLVGMSGLLLVQRLALRVEQTSTHGLCHELANLHSTIKELQQEIRQIKKPPPLTIL